MNRASVVLEQDSSPADAGKRRDIVHFANGLPGFKACHGFVLIAAEHAGLQYLTSVDGPSASFLVVDPRRVQAGYRCHLGEADRLALKVEDDAPLLWLSIVTVEADGTVAVNLRAPIVINPATMLGQQVIPYESLYPLRHILFKA